MNTNYEFISTPPLVIETNGDGEETFWINEGRDYASKSPHVFSKFIRDKNLTPSEVKFEAWKSEATVTKVRCIADLKPGLYKKLFASSDPVFLNPYLVPVKKLPSATEPPEKFVSLRERRAELLKEEKTEDKLRRYEVFRELSALTEQLIEIFEKERGVKRVRFNSRWNHPWRLLKIGDQPSGFPCDRQAQLYQGKGRLIWVSQPALTDWDYSDPWDEAQVVGFARQHGLTATLSPNWGWRWPGETALLEWQKT